MPKLRIARTYLQKPARVRSFASGYLRKWALSSGLHKLFNLPTYPKTLFINLTNVCNVHCKMCQYESSNRLNTNIKALTLADIKKLIDDVKDTHPNISFVGGGEPLCNPDVVKIVEYIHAQGLFVGLTTNGLLLEKMADDLIAAGIDYVTVSLDGPSAIHDQIRGREGCFAAALRGIQAVKKHKGVIVQIATTVFDLNYRHILELFEILSTLPIDARFGALMMNFVGAQQIELHNKLYPSLFSAQLIKYDNVLQERPKPDELLRLMDTATKKFGVIWAYRPRNAKEVEEYFTRPETYLNHSPVRCPWLYSTVTNEGKLVFCIDVVPCDGVMLGNFKESSFKSVWTGEKAREFRQILERDKRLPVCSRCCAHLNPWNGL